MDFVIMFVYLLFAGIAVYLGFIEKVRLCWFFLIVAVLLFIVWLFDELYILFVNIHKLLELGFY